ncbi:MAG: autotransporter outer membrane beta-barrel domain-containing protein [Leptospirales bacterium]
MNNLLKKRILISFLLVVPSLVFAEPIETGSMHAGLKSIGSDRPADIMENPGLLSFPTTSEKNGVLLRDTLNIYLGMVNPLFGGNRVSSYLTNSTSLGYAHFNRAKGKMSFGIFLHNNFQNVFEEMGYYLPLQSIIPSTMSVTDKSMSFEFTPVGVHGGLGASLKLSASQSIGLSVLVSYLSLDYIRKSSMTFKETSGSLTGYSEEKNQSKLVRLKTGVILGYVNHTREGDLTLSVQPFSYMQDTMNRNIDYLYNYNGSDVDNITSKTKYKNAYMEPIKVQLGVSQKIFPFMKVYLEGDLMTPMTIKYKTDELDADSTGSNAQIITFNVKEKFDFSPTLKLGFAFILKNSFYINAGFSWFSGSKTLIYKNKNDKSDNVSQVYDSNNYEAQLGVSKLFIHRILVYLSATYHYSKDIIQDNKYISSTLYENEYESYFSRIDINAGAEFHF